MIVLNHDFVLLKWPPKNTSFLRAKWLHITSKHSRIRCLIQSHICIYVRIKQKQQNRVILKNWLRGNDVNHYGSHVRMNCITFHIICAWMVVRITSLLYSIDFYYTICLMRFITYSTQIFLLLCNSSRVTEKKKRAVRSQRVNSMLNGSHLYF